MRKAAFILTLGVLAACLLPGVAHASPQIVTSTPENHEEMDEAPDTVTITFDLALEPVSLIKVVDECGRQVDAGDTVVAGNTMRVSIAKTPSGAYQAYYRARPPGGVTGEATGYIMFHVKDGKPCGPPSARTNVVSHEGHEGHEGHAGHEGHEGHTGHGGHAGHAGHTEHASHASHDDHSAHADHSTHAGHDVDGHDHSEVLGLTRGKGKGKSAPQAGGGAAALAAPLGLDDVGDATMWLSLGLTLLIGAGGGLILRKLSVA